MLEDIIQKLKQIREQKEIPLEEIASQTRIRLALLKAIEENDFSDVGSEAQARGFLKLYAAYLNIDFDSLTSTTNLLTEETSAISQIEPKEEGIRDDEILTSEVNSISPIPDLTIDENFPDEDVLTDVIIKETPNTPSEEMFRQIGQELHNRRNLISLSLQSIEDQIHINHDYLDALEKGEINLLPSTVQARGMLQNYARFLNLNTDAVLLQFAEALQQRRIESLSSTRDQSSRVKKASRVTLSLKKFFTLDLLFGSFLIIGILAFLIWGTINMVNHSESVQITDELPEIADVLAATSVETIDGFETYEMTEEATPVEETGTTPTPLFTAFFSDTIFQVVVIANQDTWISVTSDDEQLFEGRLLAGDVSTFTAEDQLELTTGNAAGLQIFFNEEALGPVGSIAQVVKLVFNRNGLVRPTPTPTLTPTLTPNLTTTINPTNTSTREP